MAKFKAYDYRQRVFLLHKLASSTVTAMSASYHQSCENYGYDLIIEACGAVIARSKLAKGILIILYACLVHRFCRK
jgi:hypothetical protein